MPDNNRAIYEIKSANRNSVCLFECKPDDKLFNQPVTDCGGRFLMAIVSESGVRAELQDIIPTDEYHVLNSFTTN
jgi:hypothetical protein